MTTQEQKCPSLRWLVTQLIRTKKRSLIITGLILILWYPCGSWIRHAWNNRDGICRCDFPRGKIGYSKIYTETHGWLAESSVVIYTLYYPGTYDHSGESCWYGRRVTEAEFDRQTRD